MVAWWWWWKEGRKFEIEIKKRIHTNTRTHLQSSTKIASDATTLTALCIVAT